MCFVSAHKKRWIKTPTWTDHSTLSHFSDFSIYSICLCFFNECKRQTNLVEDFSTWRYNEWKVLTVLMNSLIPTAGSNMKPQRGVITAWKRTFKTAFDLRRTAASVKQTTTTHPEAPSKSKELFCGWVFTNQCSWWSTYNNWCFFLLPVWLFYVEQIKTIIT